MHYGNQFNLKCEVMHREHLVLFVSQLKSEKSLLLYLCLCLWSKSAILIQIWLCQKWFILENETELYTDLISELPLVFLSCYSCSVCASSSHYRKYVLEGEIECVFECKWHKERVRAKEALKCEMQDISNMVLDCYRFARVYSTGVWL